jgi:hypothetical protein
MFSYLTKRLRSVAVLFPRTASYRRALRPGVLITAESEVEAARDSSSSLIANAYALAAQSETPTNRRG